MENAAAVTLQSRPVRLSGDQKETATYRGWRLFAVGIMANPDDAAVLAAIRYVVDQEFPLLIWTTEVPELNLKGGRIV